MTTAAFLQSLEQGLLTAQYPIQTWHQEYQAWQYWQKLLAAYEEALESLKRV